MQQKQRVFIYDRKEMGILTLLGVMVAVFAFTLGVHLGKKVASQPKTAGQETATAPAATVNDQLPEPRELYEQAKGVDQAAEEALSQSLKQEVGQVGVKTEKPVQVELPKQPKAKNAGATTLNHLKKLSERLDHEETLPGVLEKEAREAANKGSHSDSRDSEPASASRFTLQIGSYPALADAQSKIDEVAKSGLKAYLKEAELRGRGRWYRVYLGEYTTKAAAEKAGERYRLEHVIDSFIVAKVGP